MYIKASGAEKLSSKRDYGKYIVIGDTQVFLADYFFWAENELLLDQWCENNHAVRAGMIITFSDRASQLMFILQWGH